MLLLNVRTLKIENFSGQRIPPYTILSHTRGSNTEEASYKSWRGRWSALWRANGPGYHKLLWTCKQAIANRLDYIWIDTICIDKSSSQKLSEAINSMYAWYRDANICYVYLADVPAEKTSKDLHL